MEQGMPNRQIESETKENRFFSKSFFDGMTTASEMEADFVGDKYFDSFKGKIFKENGQLKNAKTTNLYDEMQRRKAEALQMLNESINSNGMQYVTRNRMNGADNSVFVIAREVGLPVRVVRELEAQYKAEQAARDGE